ncbi:hypothetical protein EDB81DRAFT_884042 [Dactylonectria macrodidyma]|uniref:Hydroxyneurosporene synthase n=1 Tax=Dactylonectria macrodidyma TaxID=307937 RepID=A0A9P9ER54_9HYPO|nr:hypothetical protein EDB81DRAFT_884042 [Dactylonectria macrodidyma]
MAILKMTVALSALLLIAEALVDTVYIPPTMHEGATTIEELSTVGNLDGFKIQTAANSSSYDYWWFDLVSTTDDAALNIVFYNAGDIGNPQPTAVEVSGVFANGTRFLNQILSPYGAVISNGPDGVSGQWLGTGASFRGTNLEEPDITYQVKFDSPKLGVEGTVQLQSRAPAHYPCDPNVPGVTQLHLERFFWSNAVPDADVVVDLNINGTGVSFTGIGYHDKNWGDKTVLQSPKFWDWGHTRLGPYSLVWYDLLDYHNNEYHRSYIAKDGEILVVSCDESSLVTRPWGGNSTWPPALGLNQVNGVVSTFELPDGKSFVVNVTKQFITYDQLVYTRAVGWAEGFVEGTNETFKGRAFFDEFTYGMLFNPPA